MLCWLMAIWLKCPKKMRNPRKLAFKKDEALILGTRSPSIGTGTFLDMGEGVVFLPWISGRGTDRYTGERTRRTRPVRLGVVGRWLPAMAVLLLACAAWAPAANANSSGTYLAKLNELYPNLATLGPVPVSPGTASIGCTRCHVTQTGNVILGGDDNHFNAFGLAFRRTSENDLARRIAVAAETSFVPRALAFNSDAGPAATKRIAAAGAATLSVAYSAGRHNQRALSTSVVGPFDFRDADPSTHPFSITSAGAIAISSATRTPGAVYHFSIAPRNTAGFRPVDGARDPADTGIPPLRELTITVNYPPVPGPAVVESAPFLASTGTKSSKDLITGIASDRDGDPVTIRSAVTIVSVFDEDGTELSPVVSGLNPSASVTTLSFNTGAFSALTTEESRTIKLAYIVSDGFDDRQNTYTFTVNGAVAVVNRLPDVSPRTLSLSEDAALPVATDLLRADSGAPFTDDDGDLLSVKKLTPSGSTRPDLALDAGLSGNSFRVTSLGSDFESLKAGEEARYQFSYDVSDTKQIVQNTLSVIVTGENDPVTAVDFAAPATETILIQSFDLLDLSEAVDPDGDPLEAVDLADLASDPPLGDPAGARIVDGRFLELVPEFVNNIDEGDVVPVTFTFKVRDGQGSEREVKGRLNVAGANENTHAARAGLYADSLAERYPLAEFQQVGNLPTGSNREGACFTCHSVNADLDGPKDDCNSTKNFTPYGRRLCNAGRGSAIGPRLASIEPDFAPAIIEANIRRLLDEGDAPGTTAGEPLRTIPGKTIEGKESRIKEFDVREPGGAVSKLFSIDEAGQITLIGAAAAGEYVIEVFPINISGSRDRNQRVRDVKGFYPLNAGRTRVTIEIRPAGPVAVDDDFNTYSNAATIPVTLNDTGGKAQSIEIATPPLNGSVAVSGLSAVYTPDPGFVGEDAFTYIARNAAGASQPATVTVTVVPEGGAVARDDRATTSLNQPVRIDVLANDGGEPELKVRLIGTPSAGSASVTPDQRVLYTPPEGYLGPPATLVYEASNKKAKTRATVTIEIREFSGDDFSAATTDPELRLVAQALGDTCAAVSGAGAARGEAGDLIGICGDLAVDIGNGADIDQALSAIRNEEALAVIDTVELLARQTGSVLRGRIDQIRRRERGGIDASGLSVTLDDLSMSGQQLEDTMRQFMGRSAEDPLTSSRWSVFAAGEVSFADVDGSDRQQDLSLSAFSLTAGADYLVNSDLVTGFAVSYSKADGDFDGGGGVNADSFEISAYGLYEGFVREGLSLAALATYGFDSFDQNRRIAFTSNGTEVDRTASADYSGSHLNLAAELNYELPLDYSLLEDQITGTVNIFVGADYLLGWIDSYGETGAGGLNLWVDDQEFNSLLLSVGVEGSQSAEAFCSCRPYERLTINSEMFDDERSVTSRFRAADGIGSSFEVTEDNDGTTFGTLEIGTVIDAGRGAYDLSYETTFDAKGFSAHRFAATGSMPIFGSDSLTLGFGGSRDSADLGMEAAVDYQLRF